MKLWIHSRASKALTAALVVAVAALVASPARAAVPAAGATSYVALGDSYSAGLGAGSYDPASLTCYRGAHAYPVLWAAAHPGGFTFAACSGATAGQVLATQLGGLNSATSLVTITIGGNDVGFVAIIGTCTVASAAVCGAAVAGAEALARTVVSVALAATYAEIKRLAPNARLVVLGYPRIFETGASCGLFGMSQANRIAVNGGADVLDSVIQARAQAAGATYVDVRSEFAGHGVCAASPWINGLAADVVDSYHPNAAGYLDGYLPALDSATG
jgi:lysophospholipase L1-like esterase